MVAKLRAPIKIVGLAGAAVFLSFFTVVLGGAPLLALRSAAGRLPYLLISTLLVGTAIAIMPPELWAPLLATVVLIAIFFEAELAGAKLALAGLISLLGTSGVIGLLIAWFARFQGVFVGSAIKQRVETIVNQVNQMQPNLGLDAQAIYVQAPSVAVMLMIFTLWLALVWERRLQFVFKMQQAPKRTVEMLKFALPDAAVWISLLAIVGAFVELKMPAIKIIGTNAFNVMVLLFFLQGLAVVASYFNFYRVSPVWQVFGYFVLFGQLFLLVSLFGLADYWIEFRRRLTKSNRPAETAGEV